MVHDDQKLSLPEAVIPIFEDANAMKYVSGVGLHWYMAPPNEDIGHNKHLRSVNALRPLFKDPSMMDETYKRLIEIRKDGFLLGTEACNGFYPDPEQHLGSLTRLVFGEDATTHVVKGSFQRGGNYAEDILADLSHSVSGWTDWNLVLDEKGGPNWASNVVDAPILFVSKNEYIRQPMFYYLGHFSRFMPPGTRHVATQKTHLGKPGTFELTKGQRTFGWPGNVFIEVFYREDVGHFVIQLLNRQKSSKRWSVISGDEAIWGEISGQTIQTVLWKPMWLSQ
jgi:glucosylceramidase